MAKEKKHQHVIPASYLRAWCDPSTPPGQNAYIWRIPRAGGNPFKKSPEKSFVSNNRYTIRMPNGDRDLTVEDTLGGLENRFVRIRQRLVQRERLSFRERVNLCLFVAAMHTRTIRMGEHWRSFHSELHEKVLSLERQHNVRPDRSNELAEYVERAPQDFVMVNLEVLGPLLVVLNHSILTTNDPVGFITSDSPSVWFLPRAHKLPPGMRNPALMHEDIEITLPLSPHMLLLMGHVPGRPFRHVTKDIVTELNRRTRFYSDQEIVSRSHQVEQEWFNDGVIPADAWEFSEEGRRSQAEMEKYRQYRTEALLH